MQGSVPEWGVSSPLRWGLGLLMSRQPGVGLGPSEDPASSGRSDEGGWGSVCWGKWSRREFSRCFKLGKKWRMMVTIFYDFKKKNLFGTQMFRLPHDLFIETHMRGTSKNSQRWTKDLPMLCKSCHVAFSKGQKQGCVSLFDPLPLDGRNCATRGQEAQDPFQGSS